MELKSVIKGCLVLSLLSFSLSAIAADKQQDNAKLKQIDMRVVTSGMKKETWEITPPYNAYGFGQSKDDTRIQKIIVHVNEKVNNDSDEESAMVKLNCNNSKYIIHAGETVVCERSMDNYAGLLIVPDENQQNPSSVGTVKFIMEDITGN
jgi:hypothetical protein